ncbi:uncharacterized protein GJ701_005521 [Geothlypis trichas]
MGRSLKPSEEELSPSAGRVHEHTESGCALDYRMQTMTSPGLHSSCTANTKPLTVSGPHLGIIAIALGNCSSGEPQTPVLGENMLKMRHSNETFQKELLNA